MEGGHNHPTALWIRGIASNVNYCRRKFRSKSRVKIERRN